MKKLDIAKKLFEHDKKVAKDIHGIYHSIYNDPEWSDLDLEWIQYYHERADELIQMVRELE